MVKQIRPLIMLTLLSLTLTAKAQTQAERDSAKQDSAHHAYHMMRKKDPKQNNPYAFADSAKSKKPVKKKKTN